MRTPAVRLFLLALFVHLVSPTVHAGPLTGRVVGPDRRGVPGAHVLIVTGTTVVTRALTDAAGRFSMVAPDSGQYEVRVAVDGLRAAPSIADGSPTATDLGTIALEISAIAESVVVSAAQVEVPLSTTSSSVTVVTGDELRQHQAESVAEALRLVPGLSVAASGGRGALTSVFPRGGEADYSLVIIDGVQANSFGGGFDFAQLPAVNIERIEIVRGPQSALYGANAIGSVIRIVTRRGGRPSGAASIEGGGFGTSRVTAASSGAVGALEWGGSVERLRSDGLNGKTSPGGVPVSNDDYERNAVSGTAGWRHAAGATIRGSVGFLKDERGFPGPFGENPGNTYEGIDAISRGDNDRWLLSAGGSTPLGRVRLSADTSYSRLDSAFASAFGESESNARRTTGRVQADATIVGGLDGSGGIEVLGERAGGTFITATGDVLVPVKRGLVGLFGEARWNRASRLFVTGGIRVERITREALPGDADAFAPRPAFIEDTVVSVNPKLSAAYYIGARDGNFTKVRGAAGTGIRPPDAFDIAFTDNPSLKPERSQSGELGVDQALFGGRALVEATAFFNTYDDLIVAVGSFAGASRYRTDNISNARSRGLEVAASARGRIAQRAGLVARIAYTRLATEIRAVDNSGDAPPPFSVGDVLLRRPTHRFSADLTLDAGRLTAFVQGGGRSSIRDVDPSFGTFGGIFNARGYAAWNAGASVTIVRRVEVFGRMLNLFDRRYEEALGFPALGRSAMAGVRVAAGR